MLYRWYKIMSPRINLTVNNVGMYVGLKWEETGVSYRVLLGEHR